MENTRLTGSQYVGTPASVGPGRGVLATPIPFPDIGFTMGGANNSAELLTQANSALNANESPVHVNTSSETTQPISTSTPVIASDMSQMANIVQQVGLQLTDSILTHLNFHSGTEATSSHAHTSDNSRYTPQQSHASNTSHIQVVRQREVQNPPIFRGDSRYCYT